LPEELLLGLYEFRKTAATSKIPRRTMITTAEPRCTRLIVRTMADAGFKDSGGSYPESGGVVPIGFQLAG
jgi:hypothetical protein